MNNLTHCGTIEIATERLYLKRIEKYDATISLCIWQNSKNRNESRAAKKVQDFYDTHN